MSQLNREIARTRDGSVTLFVPGLDEHYHSVHGALQESRHVFIEAGLRYVAAEKKEISVLEVGLGTGLNALLTAIEAEEHQLSIHYTSIEKFPVSPAELDQLDYQELVKNENGLLKSLHEATWKEWTDLSPRFHLLKLKTDLKNFREENQYDLIYFDAFAPSAQPDLWTMEIFKSMYRSLKPGGILVTYCVKGEVRRNMKAAGFEVEKIPGPPGKREMARTRKPPLT